MCGQGEWRTKSKAYKDWTKHAMLRAPKTCLNYTTKRSGWLGGCYCALLPGRCTSWTVLSSRARAGLQDSFQQRLCWMLLGGLGFSGLAHPVKAKRYRADHEWRIDVHLQGNATDGWYISGTLCWERFCGCVQVSAEGCLCFPTSVFQVPQGRRRRTAKGLTLGIDSRNMKARREP